MNNLLGPERFVKSGDHCTIPCFFSQDLGKKSICFTLQTSGIPQYFASGATEIYMNEDNPYKWSDIQIANITVKINHMKPSLQIHFLLLITASTFFCLEFVK